LGKKLSRKENENSSNAEKQAVKKIISKSPEDKEVSPNPGKYSRQSAAAYRGFSVSFSLPFPSVHFFSQSYLLNKT